MSRADILLAPVATDSRVIEIGPSHSPLAPKGAGWNTAVLDHLSREGLVAKYQAHPGVDVDLIEEVDFVWSGGSMRDAVPKEQWGTFDAFIASHVIEHTPDFIAFLQSAEALLNRDGLVVLAIPDKRYCFDFFQPVTTTGQVLAAHAQRRSRHSPRLGFDYHAYTVAAGENIAWGQHPLNGLRFVHHLTEARDIFQTIESRPDYVDLHAWRFTPSSFELLLLELAWLGILDWRAERITPSGGCEFYAWLQFGGKAVAAALNPAQLAERRMRLLKQSLIEIRAQIDCLIAGEPELANGHLAHSPGS
jgi:SAM-dependent methyltransferase